jgi:hypothetical protein
VQQGSGLGSRRSGFRRRRRNASYAAELRKIASNIAGSPKRVGCPERHRRVRREMRARAATVSMSMGMMSTIANHRDCVPLVGPVSRTELHRAGLPKPRRRSDGRRTAWRQRRANRGKSTASARHALPCRKLSMTIALLGALSIGQFFTASVIAFLVLFAETNGRWRLQA